MANFNDLFDQEIKALFDQSLEVLNNRYSLSAGVGEQKPVVLSLKKYKSIYMSTLPRKHFIYFKKLFNSKKGYIINTLNDDKWLRKDVVIQFGEHIELLKGKCEHIKICLSQIYKCALELQESAYKIIGDMNQDILEPNKDLTRPSFLLLHLLRIFYCVCDDADRDMLIEPICKLESDLSIKNRIIQPKTNNYLANIISDIESNPDGSVLDPFFGPINTLLRSIDPTIDADLPAPRNNQISEGLKTLTENETIKNGCNAILASLKNTDENIFTTLGNFAQQALTPENMKSVSESFVALSKK